MKFRQWEIWRTDVAFQEDADISKKRPALVLTVTGKDSAVGLYITSQSPRPGYRDFPIESWKDCGLEKPSVIRLDKTVPMNSDVCLSKVGELDRNTILRLRINMADESWYYMKNK